MHSAFITQTLWLQKNPSLHKGYSILYVINCETVETEDKESNII